MATVGEIMSRDLLTVEPGVAIADVVRQMHEREVGAVLVLSGEELAGIFTERDVLHAAATGKLEGAAVGDLMSGHPETIDASDSTGHAFASFLLGDVQSTSRGIVAANFGHRVTQPAFCRRR